MDYAIVGDIEALLSYPTLEVGMTFLLPGMIAKEKDIHDSASRTKSKRRTPRRMASQPHPAIVLEINKEARFITVAMTRTFDRMTGLDFMSEEERGLWAPVNPASWQAGVDALFDPPLQLVPLADESNGEQVPSWVYLGKIFKYSHNTPLPKELKGPLRQRFSPESVGKILTGLQRCNATEDDVAHRLTLAGAV